MNRSLLVGDRVAWYDAADEALVSAYHWCLHRTGRCLYARGYRKDLPRRSQRLVYMHRLLLGQAGEVDHADGNGLNNRRSNLRQASRSENTANRYRARSESATGRKGIARNASPNGGWNARICKSGVRYYLGSFDTPELAVAAYDARARELFPDFGHA